MRVLYVYEYILSTTNFARKATIKRKMNKSYTMYTSKTYKDNLPVPIFFSPTAPDEKPQEEEWKDTPSDVEHLTDKNFDEFMAGNPSVLVMFYAPCKYLLLGCFASQQRKKRLLL